METNNIVIVEDETDIAKVKEMTERRKPDSSVSYFSKGYCTFTLHHQISRTKRIACGKIIIKDYSLLDKVREAINFSGY